MSSFTSEELTGLDRFALNNIQYTLAHLIWAFDLKLADEARNWAVNQKIFNGWQQPALPVLLEERDW